MCRSHVGFPGALARGGWPRVAHNPRSPVQAAVMGRRPVREKARARSRRFRMRPEIPVPPGSQSIPPSSAHLPGAGHDRAHGRIVHCACAASSHRRRASGRGAECGRRAWCGGPRGATMTRYAGGTGGAGSFFQRRRFHWLGPPAAALRFDMLTSAGDGDDGPANARRQCCRVFVCVCVCGQSVSVHGCTHM